MGASTEKSRGKRTRVARMNVEKKDITKVLRGIIAHGVNCQRKMGSGVARELYETWPLIKSQYLKTEPELGKVDFVRVQDTPDPLILVANCYTQTYYGNDGRRYASARAIKKCLKTVFETAKTVNLPVYLPRIGSDRGGLDWETEVLPVIEEASLEIDFDDITICLWP